MLRLLMVSWASRALGNDFGQVSDESPVPGAINPQMDSDVIMCTEGTYYLAGQCYEYCKDGTDGILDRCYDKKCPKGWSEDPSGLVCKKNGLNIETKPKKSYKRKWQDPKTCKLGESFGPGAVEDNGNRDFTVIMFSDPQLTWPSCFRGTSEHKSSDEAKKCAVKDQYKLVRAAHAIQSLTWPQGVEEAVGEPIGVFINGDLTAYGHPWQLHLYRQVWETNKEEEKDKNIKMPVWPGLGNHDYKNNLYFTGGCLAEEPTWAAYGSQACAQRMVGYVRASVAGCGKHVVNPNFGGHVDHYEKKSAGYAVKYGRVRLVQLHNYPTYRRSELVGLASTMGFLKKQVRIAEEKDEYLVVLMHDVNDHFSYDHRHPQVARHDYYSEVMQGSRVLAVFAGHLHPQGGFKDHVRDSRNRTAEKTSEVYVTNKWGQKIPNVLGWAGEYLRFVTVQFNIADCYWRFGSTSAPDDEGPVRWHEAQEKKNMQVFQIPNCTVDPNYTWNPPTTTEAVNFGEISAASSLYIWPILALLAALI